MSARRGKFRVGIVVQLVALGLLPVLSACASKSHQRDDSPLVAHSDAKTDDEILYAAVLDVFAERGVDLHLEDAKRGIVMGTWTEVNREVRHRWVARVIRSNVGLVLTVDSRYERKSHEADGPGWLEADDPYTVKDKRRDEQEMGSAIQSRFKALGGGG